MKSRILAALGSLLVTGCGPDVSGHDSQPGSEATVAAEAGLDGFATLQEGAMHVEASVRHWKDPGEVLLSVNVSFSDRFLRAQYPHFDGLEKVSVEIPLLTNSLGIAYAPTDVVGVPDRYNFLQSFRAPYGPAILEQGVHIQVRTNVGQFRMFVRPELRE